MDWFIYDNGPRQEKVKLSENHRFSDDFRGNRS